MTLSRSLEGSLAWISCPSQIATSNQREAKMGSGGLESRARCAGSSVTEIGNRKECLRVREAGASAAGRGQRPYASFPDRVPRLGVWGMKSPIVPLLRSHEEKQSGSRAKPDGRFTHYSVLFESLIKNTKNTLSPSMERTCFVKFRNPILSAECVTQSCFPYIALVTCCPCLVSFST